MFDLPVFGPKTIRTLLNKTRRRFFDYKCKSRRGCRGNSEQSGSICLMWQRYYYCCDAISAILKETPKKTVLFHDICVIYKYLCI